MLMTLLGSLLGSLGDSVIKALFGLLTSEMDRRNLLAQGAATQAASETAVSAKVEAGMAAAEANAPRTDAGVDKRLTDGTF